MHRLLRKGYRPRWGQQLGVVKGVTNRTDDGCLLLAIVFKFGFGQVDHVIGQNQKGTELFGGVDLHACIPGGFRAVANNGDLIALLGILQVNVHQGGKRKEY